LQQLDKITTPNNLLFEQVVDYLGQGKDVTIRVKGNSMRPFLTEGDRVKLKPFTIGELKKGAIVLAKLNGQMVLHRVVQYNKISIWLAGDQNLVVRELVGYPDVVATVTTLYRGEAVVDLNQQWRRQLGQAWYWARPFRRVIKKCMK
jgi:signal peptidase